MIRLKRYFWISLCLTAAVVGCALTTPKKLTYNNVVNGKPISVREEWNMMTRTGDLSLSGSRTQEMGGVVAVGDTLFFGNLLGKFFAVDRFRGRTLWSVQLPSGIESTPLVADKVIYVGCNDGWLYALTIHGGRILWKKELAAELVGQASFADGMLFVHLSNGRIVALDASTGKWMWEVARPQVKDKSIRGSSKPIVNNHRVYVGTIDGSLLVLNTHDGTKIWERPISPSFRFTDVDTTPLVTQDRVIVSAYDGKTYALTLKDGGILWAYPEGGVFGAVQAGQNVILPTQSSTVEAIDIVSGKTAWKAEFDFREGIATGLAVDNGLAAFGTTSGSSYLISLADGHFVWRFKPGAGMTSAPLLFDSSLYFFSNYGNLYAFSLR